MLYRKRQLVYLVILTMYALVFGFKPINIVKSMHNMLRTCIPNMKAIPQGLQDERAIFENLNACFEP